MLSIFRIPSLCQNVNFQLEYVSGQGWQLLSHILHLKILRIP